jgi:predicted phage terminase large subunit-like protein
VNDDVEIRLHDKQEEFLASEADIAIGGGAAGGGKTYALLLEPLRHFQTNKFNSVMLRRTYPEITKTGGVWDYANELYPMFGGVPNAGKLEYRFAKSKIGFGHLTNEQSLSNWKSAQVALLMFDQLETFTERQFFYMLSRNRSVCSVNSYLRATANPEPNWLAKFLDWWIAPDGYADMERAGKIRAFVRGDNGEMYWADTKQELREQFPDKDPKTVTFVPFTIYDNPILTAKDPGYLASLQALPLVDRERLLGDPIRGGNWKIREAEGKLFNREWYKIVDAVPNGGVDCRFWDLAATEAKFKGSDPDYTASVKMRFVDGKFYVLDMTAQRISPTDTDRAIANLARQDLYEASKMGTRYVVRWEREGGASGKRDSLYIAGLLIGFDARGVAPSGDKISRAKPFAAQSEAGNVYLLAGSWNDEWINHMHSQPDMKHDDIMDATSGAFNELASPYTVTSEELERYKKGVIRAESVPADLLEYSEKSGVKLPVDR